MTFWLWFTVFCVKQCSFNVEYAFHRSLWIAIPGSTFLWIIIKCFFYHVFHLRNIGTPTGHCFANIDQILMATVPVNHNFDDICFIYCSSNSSLFFIAFNFFNFRFFDQHITNILNYILFFLEKYVHRFPKYNLDRLFYGVCENNRLHYYNISTQVILKYYIIWWATT